MRVVVVEDHALLRAGVVELLKRGDLDVVGEAADAETGLALIRACDPDVVVLDVRMPPGHSLEGIELAETLRAEHPHQPILLLTQYVAAPHLTRLLARGSAGLGYLLKDRVLDPSELIKAVRRVGAGGSAIDPVVVEQLMRRSQTRGELGQLTERELEILGLIAEGRSNASIASALWLSQKTVEGVVGRVFHKLGLEDSPSDNRRVLAVLAYLRAGQS